MSSFASAFTWPSKSPSCLPEDSRSLRRSARCAPVWRRTECRCCRLARLIGYSNWTSVSTCPVCGNMSNGCTMTEPVALGHQELGIPCQRCRVAREIPDAREREHRAIAPSVTSSQPLRGGSRKTHVGLARVRSQADRRRPAARLGRLSKRAQLLQTVAPRVGTGLGDRLRRSPRRRRRSSRALQRRARTFRRRSRDRRCAADASSHGVEKFKDAPDHLDVDLKERARPKRDSAGRRSSLRFRRRRRASGDGAPEDRVVAREIERVRDPRESGQYRVSSSGATAPSALRLPLRGDRQHASTARARAARDEMARLVAASRASGSTAALALSRAEDRR